MGLLVLVVLFLVIMPMLLYLMGMAVTRYTKKAPSWIGFPARERELNNKLASKAPRRVEP